MTKNCNSEGIKQFNGHKLRGFHLMSVLLLLTHFTISVFDYTDCPCFEVKDEEDLLLEKTVRGYWNLWERRMTPAPDYFMHQTGSLTT